MKDTNGQHNMAGIELLWPIQSAILERHQILTATSYDRMNWMGAITREELLFILQGDTFHLLVKKDILRVN